MKILMVPKIKVEFALASTGCRLKTAQNGRQVGVSSRWSNGRVPILHALFLQRQVSGNQWQRRFEIVILPSSPLT